MSEPPTLSRSPRRHPWPRVLVRARHAWFGVVETASFLGAALAAVARALMGRWPEPAGADGSKIDATMKDGVLTIAIPKRPGVEPKTIEIQSK